MVAIIDVEAEFAKLTMLQGRTPTSSEDERAGAFARLAPYRDGAVFTAKFSGVSAWERHPNGDEIVYIVDGLTTLHWAVLADHPEVVKTLIAHGAEMNAVDRFGYTPLLYAAHVDFGDADTAKVLLAAGADAKVKTKEGKTAAMLAHDYPQLRAAFASVK